MTRRETRRELLLLLAIVALCALLIGVGLMLWPTPPPVTDST